MCRNWWMMDVLILWMFLLYCTGALEKSSCVSLCVNRTIQWPTWTMLSKWQSDTSTSPRCWMLRVWTVLSFSVCGRFCLCKHVFVVCITYQLISVCVCACVWSQLCVLLASWCVCVCGRESEWVALLKYVFFCACQHMPCYFQESPTHRQCKHPHLMSLTNSVSP